MPIFSHSDVQAANTQTVNILAGSKFEFLPRASGIRVYAAQNTVAGSDVQMDFTLGNVVIGDDLNINQRAVSTGPTTNEDLIASGAGAGGDRVQIRLREVGGTDQTGVRVRVEIIDL